MIPDYDWACEALFGDGAWVDDMERCNRHLHERVRRKDDFAAALEDLARWGWATFWHREEDYAIAMAYRLDHFEFLDWPSYVQIEGHGDQLLFDRRVFTLEEGPQWHSSVCAHRVEMRLQCFVSPTGLDVPRGYQRWCAVAPYEKWDEHGRDMAILRLIYELRSHARDIAGVVPIEDALRPRMLGVLW